ncbi:MAG: hypothetical protein K1X89_14070 [Myxococcaceae bacterium]|nr:hypothetical protein [Myxococcaceae bacterium]
MSITKFPPINHSSRAGSVAAQDKGLKNTIAQLRRVTGPAAATAHAYADALERAEAARVTANRPGATKADRDALGEANKAKNDAFQAYAKEILQEQQAKYQQLASLFEPPKRGGPRLS